MIRLVSRATCASGDPVSASRSPYSARISLFCAVDSATGRSSPVIVYRASANNAVSTDLSRPPRTAAGSLATLPADLPTPGAALDHECPTALRELSGRHVGCRSTLL